MDGQDLVVDCADGFDTRYVVNRACCRAGIPLVEGGVVGTTGLVMSVRPGESACYRCAFPSPPADAPSCASAGILGPAAGVIGSIQALEALKLLTGQDGPLLDAFLSVDLSGYEVTRVSVTRLADCPDCGRPTI
jgi:molybdopterin/thiamine biosynthesis adenylyltransferase